MSADAKSSEASSGKADDSSSLSAPGYVACARLIVEGTVADVEPVPGAAQDRVVLAVDRGARTHLPTRSRHANVTVCVRS